MADQGRWFKLWVSAPGDPSLQGLSPSLRWAWATLGCYTKLHGTNGQLVLNGSNPVLAAEMGIDPDALLVTIRMLPHVRVEEGKPRHGLNTVTWDNWHKYQEDTTMAERQRRSRSKRRREEKRSIGSSTTTQNSVREMPASRAVLSDQKFLQALRTNPAYQRLDLDHELAKMDIWLQTPRGRGKKKTRGRIVAWLNRALEDLPLEQPGGEEPYGFER